MLQKIKDLMRIKQEIDSISSKTEESSRASSELRAELESLRKELSEMKGSQKEFLKALKEDLHVIRNQREDFAKEIFEFRLLKAHMQKKILDKFEEELQKDLQVNREILKKDIDDYEGLRKNVAAVLSRLNMTGEEISKFVEISKSIKKEDFELNKFAGHLMEMDKEKLELMRKIDSLERLVSKIRRRELVR